jgi:hypothetical protein
LCSADILNKPQVPIPALHSLMLLCTFTNPSSSDTSEYKREFMTINKEHKFPANSQVDDCYAGSAFCVCTCTTLLGKKEKSNKAPPCFHAAQTAISRLSRHCVTRRVPESAQKHQRVQGRKGNLRFIQNTCLAQAPAQGMGGREVIAA